MQNLQVQRSTVKHITESKARQNYEKRGAGLTLNKFMLYGYAQEL